MSFRLDKYLNFNEKGFVPGEVMLEGKSFDDLKSLFSEVLNNGAHGLCYSIYEDGQKPGDIISEEQIRKRMMILKPFTKWIRSFSCIEGNELIPKVAKEFGMKTLVGAWLGNDQEKNQQEIDGLVKLAKEGLVDLAAVGNEVLYRNDLSENELIERILEVKGLIPGVPVGYVDAYYEFVTRPRITEACDVVLCNCYPYWEGTDFQYSAQHMKNMYFQAVMAAKGKKVIITETGWPSKGEGLGSAMPSVENAMKYFINTQLWSMDEGVEIFYFSSFDEAWKVGAEGEVGAHWGIWDKHNKLKFVNE